MNIVLYTFLLCHFEFVFYCCRVSVEEWKKGKSKDEDEESILHHKKKKAIKILVGDEDDDDGIITIFY